MVRCHAVASVTVQHHLHPTRVALRGGAFDCIGAAITAARLSTGIESPAFTLPTSKFIRQDPQETISRSAPVFSISPIFTR